MSRILHTSDWHLGATLLGEERQEHFSRMIEGIFQLICERNVTCLLISGDIFDGINPPISAQNLYYGFLARLQASPCKEVVVTSGNHDSARMLAAPSSVLEKIGVHVVTKVGEEENLVPVGSDTVILALPFLREGDQVAENVGEYLSLLSDKAKVQYPGRRQIVMAHQYLVGSMMDNGKEELDYVGNLAPFPSSIFPEGVDYVALGHIHRPQMVKGAVPIRYSGSPLPVDFGEAGYKKQVVLIDTEPWGIEPIDLPPFCNLVKLEGDLPLLEKKLQELATREESVWVSADYIGEEPVQDLRKKLYALVEHTPVKLVQVMDKRAWHRQKGKETVKDLKTLTPMQVFERKLESRNFDERTKATLRMHVQEIIHEIEHPEENV